MAQLNTRIVLRNDIASNYEAVKDDLVLLKGEVGIEFNFFDTYIMDFIILVETT